ncbi:(2Fe-2S)-binding protein [Amycolatopsis magusensis]|uniref:(2Fe-2S)-binding protein n=1 Tax=Amycolatopsis magusensis TaxID=882444 RepID=UPI0024A8E385|nr:(2Fe-2S)-binding protein [Amycolatopsis magusensis]MDI5976030.1 (2Fe-2S)-binding protein [Amycolatopsis magusensis]
MKATVLADPAWLREDLKTAERMYGRSAGPRVLGTVRWYSASSVIVAPSTESLFTGKIADPSLDALTLTMQPDGRYIEARSDRVLDGGLPELGQAMHAMLSAVIPPMSEVCGATENALWAIATDSIANRLLWSGDAVRAVELAGQLAGAIGPDLPKPRFTQVGRTTIVKRASCCLIYEIPRAEKCASCPRQTPEERAKRLRGFG